MIKPVAGENVAAMPETAPVGTGNRNLEQVCSDGAEIIEGLAQQGISAEPQQTMRTIAAAHGVDPHAIYAAIYAIVEQ